MAKRIALVLLLPLAALAAYTLYLVIDFSTGLPDPVGDLRSHTLVHDDLERSYAVYQPRDLPAGAPVVFILHGSMGSGLGMRDMSGREFDLLADQRGWLAVYPDGFDNHWNGCRGTADYRANVENIDDVGFLTSMLEALAEDYQIDPKRAYITGISNGGHMAYRMALEAPDVFTAYAPVAASLPAPATFGCSRSGAPVSIAIFNGTRDPVNPYLGGGVTILGNESRGIVLSTQDTVAYWRSLAGLDQPALEIDHPETDGDPVTHVSEQRWGEPGAIEVRLYTLRGSGHTMPSRTRLMPGPMAWLLGGNAADLAGPAEILDFFEGHGPWPTATGSSQ